MIGTPTSRNISDFLWDWAGNDDWKKLLIKYVIINGTALSDSERNEVYQYLLQSGGIVKGLTELKVPRPSFIPNTKKITLKKLSSITGVNKLSKDEELTFAKNLTVIYGENGAGKTGYSRILKSLGYSFDTNKSILHNIFETPEALSASISYEVDNDEKQLTWSQNVENHDLKNLSVFNNDCVKISLVDRKLLVSPMGFYLFDLITQELTLLNNLVDKEISKHPVQITFLELLHDGTPQKNYLNTISHNSSKKILDELSLWTDDYQIQLDTFQKEHNGLNRELMDINKATLRLEIDALNTIKNSISSTQQKVNLTNHTLIQNTINEIEKLEQTETIGLKDIAETNKITLYDSKEFLAFITAADNYIKVLNVENYPNNIKDTCVYCKQEFKDVHSRNLLSTYESLLNNTTKDSLKLKIKQYDEFVKVINTIEDKLVFLLPIFGRNPDDTIKQPNELLQYNSFLKTYKELFANRNSVKGYKLTYTYDSILKIINDTIAKKEKEVGQLDEIIINIIPKETQLKQRINELVDRKAIFERKSIISTVIDNFVRVNALTKCKGKLSTNSLSRKTSEAREELIADNFASIFKDELKQLRKSNIDINLDFGTSKGQSKVHQAMHNGFGLLDVLSEGEQKAIALSEFLTEIQLDPSSSPIIFDDPVNSLDHHLIDDVAKRLIKLSKDRQVIIFTHSILLYNCLYTQQKLTTYKDIESKNYYIKTEHNVSGILSEGEEKNSLAYYKTRINSQLENSPKGTSERDIAEQCYSLLRSKIELLVEQSILNHTIVRYKKNVSLDKLISINGQLLDKHKQELNDVYDRCCRYTSAHSNPIEAEVDAKIDEFKQDYKIILELVKVFKT